MGFTHSFSQNIRKKLGSDVRGARRSQVCSIRCANRSTRCPNSSQPFVRPVARPLNNAQPFVRASHLPSVCSILRSTVRPSAHQSVPSSVRSLDRSSANVQLVAQLHQRHGHCGRKYKIYGIRNGSEMAAATHAVTARDIRYPLTLEAYWIALSVLKLNDKSKLNACRCIHCIS